jgi:hypothetical protein
MTRMTHRDSGDKRPIARDLHPLEVGNYRIGTPAIEAFADLVKSCMDHKITGALIYGPSRIGKTRAIEYLRLAMAQNFAKVTTYHVQAEHKPKHAEGPFFTSLLEAVGCPEPTRAAILPSGCKLIDRVKDACARNGSGVVAMFCDEAQRYDENEYEWLRDVHDHLDRINIRLFTFLIGQEELHAVKTAFQQARKTQIVARLMVEELRSSACAIRRDVATCLDGYDTDVLPARHRLELHAVLHAQRLCARAIGSWTTRRCCGTRSSSCTTRMACRVSLEIPMESFARVRWRSCSRTANCVTPQTSGRSPQRGTSRRAAAATFRHGRRSAGC